MSISDRVLSGRLLTRNVIWNLLGSGLPLLVALWAIPLLVTGMGTDRFGLLTIIWMGVGYFSLFDLGIGRALTKLVAERLGDGREAELPSLIQTGQRLMFLLGLCAALFVAFLTPWLAQELLNIPEDLVQEVLFSFWLLAASLPFVVSTAGFIGILQAHQKTSQIVAIRIPLGILNFVGPVLALTITPSLVATTLVLCVTRSLAWLAFRRLCRPFTTAEQPFTGLKRAPALALLSFGGWVTASNIIGPMMVYFDRFFIGALLSMTAVTYYTTPYEVITRIWIFPEALGSVMFPALTTALVVNSERARNLFGVAARALLIVIFIPASLAILFAPEALRLWLGQEFALASTSVLRWLAAGVFINCLARLPSMTLQCTGRPDLNAKLHMAELPVYLLVLWLLIQDYGIVGAAMAWTARIAVDTWLLFFLSMRQIPELRAEKLQTMFITIGATLVLAVLPLFQPIWLKICVAVIILVAGGGFAVREIILLRTRSVIGDPVNF